MKIAGIEASLYFLSHQVIAVVFLLAGIGNGQIDSARIRLLSNLLDDYPKYLSRPVFNDSTTTTVTHGLSLIHITDIDERNQILTINFWVRQYWIDEFLRWDPDENDGIMSIRIPISLIWIPDIVLYNSGNDQFFQKFDADAVVGYDGEVGAFTPTLLTSTCRIDATFFPFDEQYCDLKFGSWSYNGFLVDIRNESSTGDVSQFIGNGEWTLVEVSVMRNEVIYKCCIEPYPDVTYTIYLKRRSLFYVISIVLPCVLMSILIILGFYLPPDAGEKITLTVTCILSLMVFLVLVSDQMPPTSEYIPYIQIYFILTIGMNCLSCVMTSLVLSLHFRSPQCRAMPKWFRFFTFTILATVVGNRSHMRRFRASLKEFEKSESIWTVMENGTDNKVERLGSYRKNENSSQDCLPSNGRLSEMLNLTVQQNCYIIKEVQRLSADIRSIDKDEVVIKEWKEAARLVDRFFLLIFTITMILITGSIMFILTVR